MCTKIIAMEFKIDQIAIRDALWTSLHLHIDPSPHVFTDEIAEKIVGDKDWRNRWDMNSDFSKTMRAMIVKRARFIEDLVIEEIQKGVSQYVILGAGLDTFSQRHPDLASKIDVYEIDRPGLQEWKRQRLTELGYTIGAKLHFVPVDFEAQKSWMEELVNAGFDASRPAIVASSGQAMYLTKEWNQSTLNQVARFVPGSTFVMSFLISPEELEEKELAETILIKKRAKEMGASFLCLFSPAELVSMAEKAGFKNCTYVPARKLNQLYFLKRPDRLNAGTAEGFLIGRT